jgi:hypothetical protein
MTETDIQVQGWTPQASDLLRLPMRIPERRTLLVALDLLALNGALLAALALRPAYELDLALVVRHPVWFLLLNAIWFPLASALDAYDVHVAGDLPKAALAVGKAALITTVAYLLIPFLTPPLPATRWHLFALPVFALALLAAGRTLYVLVLDQPAFQRRALIVGAGWAGETIAKALAENGNGTYHVVGFVDDDPQKQGTTVTWGEGETRRQGEGERGRQGDKERGRGGDRETRGQGEGEMRAREDSPPRPLTPSCRSW